MGEVTFFSISDSELSAGKGIEAFEPFVIGVHRRKGIMTEIYQRVEKITGKKVVPADNQSSLGVRFWQQKNRSFGI